MNPPVWNVNEKLKSLNLWIQMLIAESRDGFSKAWFKTVVKKGDEKMLMDAVEVDGSKLDGRFTGIFEKE